MSGSAGAVGFHTDAPTGRRARLVWTPDLESRFDAAVDSLGGLEEATPATIKEKMQTDLTLGHLKSHLQKLRLEHNAPSLKSRRSLDAGGGRVAAAAVGSRRSFDSAFCGRVDETSELSAQLESEICGFSNFKW